MYNYQTYGGAYMAIMGLNIGKLIVILYYDIDDARVK